MSAPSGPFPSFTTVNFYSGSTLNRLSWLRDDSEFLNTALHHPNTRIVVMQNLNPLVWADRGKGEETKGREGYLATLGWDQVKEHVLKAARGSGKVTDDGDFFGPTAYGITAPSHLEGRELQGFGKATAGIGATEVAFVFLGVDEEGQEISSLPGQLATRDAGEEHLSSSSNVPAGTPYFALSITYKSKSVPASDPSPMKNLEESLITSGQYDFVDTRALGRAGDWPMKDASLVAQARALLDWNERNHFCPSCSRRQYSVWGGYKRACTSSLTKLGINAQTAGSAGEYIQSLLGPSTIKDDAEDAGLGECPTTTTLSNCCYPRTDPVVIMGVLSPDGERLLLGRQKKWPQGFWSCLAGFLEVGESLEEAVRREVLEESGVAIDSVVYHSSQSWPFPSQLMNGAFGIAKACPGHDLPPVRLDLDNELEAARWYSREEILAVLDSSAKKHFSKADVKRIEEAQNNAGGRSLAEQKDPGSIANTHDRSQEGEAAFKIPPSTAIAHTLIASWARREAVLPLPGNTGFTNVQTEKSPLSANKTTLRQQSNM